MKWGTSDPEKTGWYLVTLKNGTVMPAYRKEYPPGNFTWHELMARYIDAEALIKSAIIRVEGNFDCHGKKVPFSAMPEQFITDFPVADVAPVIHGNWGTYGLCSYCGAPALRWNGTTGKPEMPHCWNCGALMDATV